jgi:hypothetical protein
MRTQHQSRNIDALGRYYASAAVSSLLIDQLLATKPRAVLDLGSGRGALSLAASVWWSRSGRRVGRTAPDKVISVAKGGVAYADCLYRIRVPAEWCGCVLTNLSSPAGRAWSEQHGYGVAARQLTRSDLLNLPLVLS